MILQTCQAQWNMGVDNDAWKIADSDNNVLFLLPPQIKDEHEVNSIRRFAMKYEELAHAEGVEMGKQAMLAANRQAMKEMGNEILLLRSMNEQLSQNLQRAIGEMEDV